jgi:hypothetical protein
VTAASFASPRVVVGDCAWVTAPAIVTAVAKAATSEATSAIRVRDISILRKATAQIIHHCRPDHSVPRSEPTVNSG